jgi:hypothetical protein
MKILKKNTLIVFIINVTILMSVMTGRSQAQWEEIIIGNVKATQWSTDDGVLAAVLLVSGEEENYEGDVITHIDEYVILDTNTGKELFELDGEIVEVKCIFLEANGGIIYLKINSYSLIESIENHLKE